MGNEILHSVQNDNKRPQNDNPNSLRMIISSQFVSTKVCSTRSTNTLSSRKRLGGSINLIEFIFGQMPADGACVFTSLAEIFCAWNGDDQLIFHKQPVEGYLTNRLIVRAGDIFHGLEQRFDLT